MMKKNLRTVVMTSLLTMGVAFALVGCGGNKSDENFTKAEKDEIDAAFSDDEKRN